MMSEIIKQANDLLAPYLNGCVLTANMFVPNCTNEYWGQGLPVLFADNSFDWAVGCPTTSEAVYWLSEMARVAPHVAIWDVVAAGHAKAEPYISAFERLVQPTRAPIRSLKTWFSLCQKAGLVIEQHYLLKDVVNLNQWALKSAPVFWKDQTPRVIQRLQAMVIQAPQPVRDWLAPQLPAEGSGEAIHITRHFALLVGRRV